MLCSSASAQAVKSSRATLLNCSLVCRWMHTTSMRVLFSVLYLSSIQEVRLLADKAQECERVSNWLRTATHTVHVTVMRRFALGFASFLPMMKKLIIDWGNTPAARFWPMQYAKYDFLACFRTVVTLELWGVRFSTIAQFQSLVDCFPSLQDFRMYHCSLRASTMSIAQKMPSPPLTSFTNLVSHQSMGKHMNALYLWLAHILSNTESIRYMSLQYPWVDSQPDGHGLEVLLGTLGPLLTDLELNMHPRDYRTSGESFVHRTSVNCDIN